MPNAPISANFDSGHCAYAAGRVRALFHGHLLADTALALVLSREGQKDCYFFPKDDIEMVVLRKNDHRGDSLTGGDVSYYTIYRDGLVIEDVAWSYDGPDARPEDIRGMITFDPDLVAIEADDTPRVAEEDRAIKDYILHTDSGSGRSQEAPWDANVSRPGDLFGESDDEDRPAHP